VFDGTNPLLCQSAELRCPRGWTSVSRPHASAFVAGNDAPLVGERAATRGRSATEGGDERGGVKDRSPFAQQPREPDRMATA
jgi:hypothetical protein